MLRSIRRRSSNTISDATHARTPSQSRTLKQRINVRSVQEAVFSKGSSGSFTTPPPVPASLPVLIQISVLVVAPCFPTMNTFWASVGSIACWSAATLV